MRPLKLSSTQGTALFLWAQQDSNLQPTSYEPGALTVELWARAGIMILQRALVGQGVPASSPNLARRRIVYLRPTRLYANGTDNVIVPDPIRVRPFISQ